MNLFLRTAVCLFALTFTLQAATPDVSNLKTCIYEVRAANANPPSIETFDRYVNDYYGLLSDLEAAMPHLPYVYQEAAAKPIIAFLRGLGEARYLVIFNRPFLDEHNAVLREIIPDAVLAVLEYDGFVSQGVNAFQEIVSDLYDGFLSEESRAGRQSGIPIEPPTYGTIPPLVKFGNQEAGPYTWPADATNYILGMGCGIVSLPPAQLNGGLLAWSALGHETSGHDVTHADEGLLDELAEKVYTAVFRAFGSRALADYWSKCIDEATADVCGYLNAGPSLGIALIGYFRALGNGQLRTGAHIDDVHPIDLLRGYLAAATVKRLNFQDAKDWSQAILDETTKDKSTLYFVDRNGAYVRFPVSFDIAVASADVVAKTILRANLSTLQGHSLQGIVNWNDRDQKIVDQIVPLFKSGGNLPDHLQGSGFYAAYMIAGATQAGLQKGADLSLVFANMQSFLASMHLQNPTWSKLATEEAIALLKHKWKGFQSHDGKQIVRQDVPEQQHLVLMD